MAKNCFVFKQSKFQQSKEAVTNIALYYFTVWPYVGTRSRICIGLPMTKILIFLLFTVRLSYCIFLEKDLISLGILLIVKLSACGRLLCWVAQTTTFFWRKVDLLPCTGLQELKTQIFDSYEFSDIRHCCSPGRQYIRGPHSVNFYGTVDNLSLSLFF